MSLKKMLVCCAGLLIFSGSIFAAPQNLPDLPPLLDITMVPSFRIEKPGTEKVIQLPQLPGKPGLIPVLICRMYSVDSAGTGGCNVCARIMFNDTPLGMLTAGGRKRLLFRNVYFHLDNNTWRHKRMKVFNGSNISVMFAKSCNQADQMTTDGMASFYMFDLSDVAHPVDVNTMTFRNIRVAPGKDPSLVVQDIQVGYLPVSALPKSKNANMTYTPGNHAITVNGTKLEVYRNGGFAVSFPGCKPFVVESSLSTQNGAAPMLKAVDSKAAPTVSIRKVNADTMTVKTTFGNISLERTLKLTDKGKVKWSEKWSNTGKEIAAVPFRHRMGLADKDARRVWMRGSTELLETIFSSNPTIFFENSFSSKIGCGLFIEDDIGRLVVNAVLDNGTVELFTNQFAIAPGKSRVLRYSLSGVKDNGYWQFINDLRREVGAGKFGMERPFFFAPVIPACPGLNMNERIQKTLGALGPITVCITPWLGRCADYFKPDQSGKSVTERYFASHYTGRKRLFEKLRLYKKLLPNAKIMTLHHAAMVRTYMPEFEQHPYADSAIRNKDGSPYSHAGYDSLILRDKTKEGWSIIYYLPLPGNALWERLMDDVESALAAGSDGAYFDEFSFCTPRDYRRYDYSSWDGFSADIDDSGKITALKSDNARTTDLFKNALLQRLMSSGKLFLGNGIDCSRAAFSSGGHGFIEGTALVNMPEAHLHHVPLALGNYGTQNTRAGVMQAVREALQLGCIYSPHVLTNTVLEGADNFVCKLYPLTITEIGPGFVAAKERLIVEKSGTFNWRGCKDGEVELYIYDVNGNRNQHGTKGMVANEKITLTVPKKGLVIAEKTRTLSTK